MDVPKWAEIIDMVEKRLAANRIRYRDAWRADEALGDEILAGNMEATPENRAEYLRVRAELDVTSYQLNTLDDVLPKLQAVAEIMEEKAEALAGRGV